MLIIFFIYLNAATHHIDKCKFVFFTKFSSCIPNNVFFFFVLSHYKVDYSSILHTITTAFSMSKIIQSGKYVLHSIIFFSMCSIAKVTMLHRFTTHAFSSIYFICMVLELKKKSNCK